MKRRNFIKASIIGTPSVLAATNAQNPAQNAPKKEFYEWREYEFQFNSPRGEVEKYFKNMEERDKNWAKFINDDAWKRISKAPEYANSVSKIYKTFLLPTAYSQL